MGHGRNNLLLFRRTRGAFFHESVSDGGIRATRHARLDQRVRIAAEPGSIEPARSGAGEPEQGNGGVCTESRLERARAAVQYHAYACAGSASLYETRGAAGERAFRR